MADSSMTSNCFSSSLSGASKYLESYSSISLSVIILFLAEALFLLADENPLFMELLVLTLVLDLVDYGINFYFILTLKVRNKL